MLKSIEGVFRGGKIELLEPAPQVEESRVLVTFFPSGKGMRLKDHGIDEAQAANLRGGSRRSRPSGARGNGHLR